MKDFPSHLFVSIEDIRVDIIDDINTSVIGITGGSKAILGLAVFKFNALLLDGYLMIAKEPNHPANEYHYDTHCFNDWIEESFLPFEEARASKDTRIFMHEDGGYEKY